jgi:hypothetical protein
MLEGILEVAGLPSLVLRLRECRYENLNKALIANFQSLGSLETLRE